MPLTSASFKLGREKKQKLRKNNKNDENQIQFTDLRKKKISNLWKKTRRKTQNDI
jgi:hypothetical protein